MNDEQPYDTDSWDTPDMWWYWDVACHEEMYHDVDMYDRLTLKKDNMGKTEAECYVWEDYSLDTGDTFMEDEDEEDNGYYEA